ncbi:hypothetical protein Moror_8177 [Moniliophthora roreri MCA 2997]|uniref:HMG box domain-containing protein n=2 Tax=Moniliophthora roreri TaxID=221103 RepID=V2XKU9_MONRO|nr:hypothetical protein Moror_8177 [Moniliophthora roreri MCA 2997]KAI3606441.1 hypothetical protein WG66_009591 [Moniliophthora roreri]
MPVTRSRRRSSLPHLLAPPSKTLPGTYSAITVPSLPHRLTFCPNVTPVSYSSSTGDVTDDLDETDAGLFPPSEEQSTTTATKRRQPPGKRRSQGYIPRPPNAFMLFRADFVKQKHVPGSIETNHSSLSRIIGNCWRSLPAQDKRIWEIKAKHAKEQHKKEYPDYKFKPVHKKKNKGAAAPAAAAAITAASTLPTPTIEKPKPVIQISTQPGERKSSRRQAREEAAKQARDDFLTQLLLLGVRGDALQDQMAEYDEKVRLQRSFDPSSDSETEWENDNTSVSASDATTLFGADDGMGSKLYVPSSSSSASSPAPSWSNPFDNNAPIDWQPQPLPSQYPSSSSSQWSAGIMTRRPSSVPPMGSGIAMDVDMSMYGWYAQPQQPQPQHQDYTTAPGEFRPPSPSPSHFPPLGISQYSQQGQGQGQIYAPQPTQKLPSFSAYASDTEFNPRMSFGLSQWLGITGNPRQSISYEHRMLLGGRRASSAQGMRRSWGTDSHSWAAWGSSWLPSTNQAIPSTTQAQAQGELVRDDEPLPDVDTSLFNPGFGFGAAAVVGVQETTRENAGAVGVGGGSPVVPAVSPLDPVPVPVYVQEEVAPFEQAAYDQQQAHVQGYDVPPAAAAVADSTTIDMTRPSFAMAYPPSIAIDSPEYVAYQGTAGYEGVC